MYSQLLAGIGGGTLLVVLAGLPFLTTLEPLQPRQGTSSDRAGTCCPHPRDMVNIDGQVIYSGTGGQIVSIYTVPAGKWFVITDLSLQPLNPVVFPVPDTTIVDVVAGTTKLDNVHIDRFFPGFPGQNYFPSAPPGILMPTTGLVFPPGGVVGLRADNNGIPGVYYSIRGYLAK